ncbi:MAG: type II secretion system minor pseudopilin GspI [Sideroxydans sp.]
MKTRGFTLLEVLVALAILAVTLGAIGRAAGGSARHAEALRERVLAGWVAQNRLALHAARGDWLPLGSNEGEETQAGIQFKWREDVVPTPNPTMRRLRIQISRAGTEVPVLCEIIAYLPEHAR